MELNGINTEAMFKMYANKATLLTNYQLCRAYFGDRGASVLRVAEMILRQKYKRSWQRKHIRQTLAQLSKERMSNKQIIIPSLKINCTANDIFIQFIYEHFTPIIIACRDNLDYPREIKEIAYKHSLCTL